jgi:phosphoribosylanthranilate isomerase
MALKTSVKVGRISNLSDARYCSGMGVHWLGFRVHENDPDYINPELFQEIRGWFSGPGVIAEIYGITSEEVLKKAEGNYQPDYLELSLKEISLIPSSSLPVLLAINGDEVATVEKLSHDIQSRIKFLIVPDTLLPNDFVELSKSYSLLLKISDRFKIEFLSLPISGIAMEGSAEDKPGIKDYALLADVLEALEEE